MASWVLVTGGAHRLGREISLAFARAGWSVACHYLRSAKGAEALCEDLRAMGVAALAVPGDLADEASTRRMFDTVVAKTGLSLQCVVNNASLFEPDTGRDFQEDLALAQLRVNLMAPMRLGKWLAVLHGGRGSPRFARDDGRASVVHVLDQKVFNLNPDYFSYTVSKLALERLVSLQAQALAPNLRVNAVAPGLMYLSGPQSQDNFDRAASANLLQQAIDPKDVARSVLFLAQTPSITGTTVRVDNGQHLVPMARDVMFVVDELFKEKP
jgi:NAD(P)-dependent dehydrogenase (short-subunit alcohol dehydrogenase family)